MLRNIFIFWRNYIVKRNIKSAQRLLPNLFIKINMNSLEEIKKLFDRLKEASKQAEKLKLEINNIKQEIHIISESEIFRQHLLNISDPDNDNEKGMFEPPTKKCKHDFVEDGGYIVVYTDGACENNGSSIGKAGIGVWFGENHSLNVSKPVRGRATNNTAEIQACICALKIAKDQGFRKIKLITDSMFVINSMTKWIRNWKRNGWKLAGGKGDVKNKTDFIELDKLCQSIDIKWEHVAGHKGIRGNEEADRLAREGAKLYKPCT